MRDYIKRFLIAGIMALFISLLFLGGKHSEAMMLNAEEDTFNWNWPSNGIVTDTYGTRNGEHKGIDIAGEYGSPVFTVDDGKVTKSYYSASYGNVVFIKHKNDTETVYAHLKNRSVKEGNVVKKGDKIGEMGSTGDSSGVHLHFEVHEKEWSQDKRNAINPVIALGVEAAIGETVQVKMVAAKQKDVVEAIGRLRQGVDGEVNTQSPKKNSEGKETVHIVRTGDSLWSIANQYHTTIQAIELLNDLQDEQIVPGQKLIIATGTKGQYTVRPGDTLDSIALKTRVSIEELKKMNGLTGDLIKPNQILKIH